MSIVSGFQYFRVKIAFAPRNTDYISPAAAFLPKGRYIVVATTAIVGNISTSLMYFTVNAPSGTGDFFIYNAITSATIVDGGATNVIYRKGVGQIIANTDNTPIYYQINVVVNGGANFAPSTAAQDAFYNYIHFIKVA